MDQAMAAAGVAVVSDYLHWQAIRLALPHLASPFSDEAFNFQSVVFGLPAQPPRWETCISRTDGALGFAVSKLYVDAAFGGDSKAAADTMIEAIRNSFEQGLPDLEWMDAATQEQVSSNTCFYRDFVLKMINFVSKMMNCVSKMTSLVFKMMNFVSGAHQGGGRDDQDRIP